MSFSPADFPGFGGLNLAADSEDSPGALDLSNVTLSQPGPSRLMARPGYTLTGTLNLSGASGIAWDGGAGVIVGYDQTLNYVDLSTGASTTSKADYTSGDPWTIVPFGNPSSTAVPVLDNPSFATNTTGWAVGTSVITRDTGVFDSTPASGRWDNTGASDNLGSNDQLAVSCTGTFHAGVPYTVILKIRPSAAVTSVLTIEFGDTTDNADTTWSIAASTTWQTFGVTWIPETTVVSPTVSTIYFTMRVTTAGACYYNVDSATLTQPGSIYACNGAAIGTLRTDGTLAVPVAQTQAAGATVFTGNRAMPKPYTLATQPKDNRLVAAGFASGTYGPHGNASSASHVYFSQPDNPEAWDETDYVVLAPGDGEKIRAACTISDYLLIFKRTKFFVFYGNSVDSTGGTVFNYRTVANAFPGNADDITQGNIAVAPDGVYVLTSQGVYRTTGGPPTLVSGALTPLFNANLNSLAYAGTGYTRINAPYYAAVRRGSGGSFFHDGSVYFSVILTRGTSTASLGWLILDTATGQWTIWELADTPKIGVSIHGGADTGGDRVSGRIYFPSGSSTTGRKGLLALDGTATTDNGTAISSYYTSPYLAYGEPKAEKHVRASELHGTGTVTLAWGKDLQTHGSAETVAMSSGIGHARTGARGRVLSFKIAASAAGWTVNRVVPLLATVRTGK